MVIELKKGLQAAPRRDLLEGKGKEMNMPGIGQEQAASPMVAAAVVSIKRCPLDVALTKSKHHHDCASLAVIQQIGRAHV